MHMKMIEQLRGRVPTLIGIEEYKKSAVVIPLIKKKDGSYDVLFQVRSGKLKRQPGEICFPGGGREANETLEQTAVREICEEMLIKPKQVEIIAAMDVLVTPNMLVHPYLAILKDYKGTYSEAEVAEVFTVPLSFFMKNKPEIYYNESKVVITDDTNLPFDRIPNGINYRWAVGRYPVMFYDYKGYNIWGMTARIMECAARVMAKAQGDK